MAGRVVALEANVLLVCILLLNITDVSNGLELRRVAKDKCQTSSHHHRTVNVASNLACTLACSTDSSCKGYCFSANSGDCRISYTDIGTALYAAVSQTGYDMFWSGYTGGWTQFGSKAYKLFRIGYNYWDARNYCLKQYARLAVPTTVEENTYLYGTLSGAYRTWINADDDGHEGQWQNTDTGGVLSQTWFCSGQPDNAGGEHCAELAHDLHCWNDIPCDTGRWFNCEIPLDQCAYGVVDIRCGYTTF